MILNVNNSQDIKSESYTNSLKRQILPSKGKRGRGVEISVETEISRNKISIK